MSNQLKRVTTHISYTAGYILLPFSFVAEVMCGMAITLRNAFHNVKHDCKQHTKYYKQAVNRLDF